MVMLIFNKSHIDPRAVYKVSKTMIFKDLTNAITVMLVKLRRYGRVGAGWFLIGLGVLGIILPLLPGIPFLFLGGWLLGWNRETWSRLLRWYPFDREALLRRFNRR